MSARENSAIQVRFAPDETGIFSGYAAAWGKRDAFGDQWMPGAFADSLRAHAAAGTRPLMLWHHDPTQPIGTWEVLREDDTGLKVTGRLVLDSTAGRDAHALMKAGALDGLSVGFRTVRATTLPKGGRQVHSVNLIEISPVTLPAQSLARIGAVRSAALAAPAAAGLAAFIREQAARLGGKQ
jgi:Escherichia/Staphylococcus phage prohead protease